VARRKDIIWPDPSLYVQQYPYVFNDENIFFQQYMMTYNVLIFREETIMQFIKLLLFNFPALVIVPKNQ
jgi:hypothetical protein